MKETPAPTSPESDQALPFPGSALLAASLPESEPDPDQYLWGV